MLLTGTPQRISTVGGTSSALVVISMEMLPCPQNLVQLMVVVYNKSWDKNKGVKNGNEGAYDRTDRIYSAAG